LKEGPGRETRSVTLKKTLCRELTATKPGGLREQVKVGEKKKRGNAESGAFWKIQRLIGGPNTLAPSSCRGERKDGIPL